MSPSGTLAGQSSPKRLRALPGLWLFPALLALHFAEEAPGFTRWAQRYASPHYTGRDFVQINAAGLASTLATTALVARGGRTRLFLPWYAAVLTQQALFNPLFHVGTTIVFRAYSPGLVSSLAFPALWRRYTRAALRAGWITPRGLGAALVLGGAIHAAAVAQQVFKLTLRRG
jgi:hypothetical protein